MEEQPQWRSRRAWPWAVGVWAVLGLIRVAIAGPDTSEIVLGLVALSVAILVVARAAPERVTALEGGLEVRRGLTKRTVVPWHRITDVRSHPEGVANAPLAIVTAEGAIVKTSLRATGPGSLQDYWRERSRGRR